jgi:hypothetical protein
MNQSARPIVLVYQPRTTDAEAEAEAAELARLLTAAQSKIAAQAIELHKLKDARQCRTPRARARYARTRAFNCLYITIRWMLRAPAPRRGPDGLPSWWPMWSGAIVSATIHLVHLARALAPFEGIDL